MPASVKIGIGSAVAVLLSALYLQWQSQRQVVSLGFWFEGVTFDVPHLQTAGLGGPLTKDEQHTIESRARAELQTAFEGFRIRVSNNRNARYRVRVVQQYPPFKNAGFGAAGQSRGIAGLGGEGSVNFLMLGSLAISQAPPGTSRGAIVEGIGRGIGRSAAHEFVHQLFPTVQIHDSTDDQSYEFGSAARPSQFYGPMRWDIAAPLLKRYFGQQRS